MTGEYVVLRSCAMPNTNKLHDPKALSVTCIHSYGATVYFHANVFHVHIDTSYINVSVYVMSK